MGDEEECINTGLCLGLGVGKYGREKEKSTTLCLDLSLKLYPKEEAINIDHKAKGSSNLKTIEDDHENFMNNNNNNKRKKLMLTKEQSSMLEDYFKLHSTLNQAQKYTIAEQLNLKPRQVEVWFQNNRARTKLKQTEVDCELLKKCCEGLSDENKRLKKELQDLRFSSLHTQSPKAATLAVCPLCEKIVGSNEGKKGMENCMVSSFNDDV